MYIWIIVKEVTKDSSELYRFNSVEIYVNSINFHYWKCRNKYLYKYNILNSRIQALLIRYKDLYTLISHWILKNKWIRDVFMNLYWNSILIGRKLRKALSDHFLFFQIFAPYSALINLSIFSQVLSIKY